MTIVRRPSLAVRGTRMRRSTSRCLPARRLTRGPECQYSVAITQQTFSGTAERASCASARTRRAAGRLSRWIAGCTSKIRHRESAPARSDSQWIRTSRPGAKGGCAWRLRIRPSSSRRARNAPAPCPPKPCRCPAPAGSEPSRSALPRDVSGVRRPRCPGSSSAQEPDRGTAASLSRCRRRPAPRAKAR
jgi:hypothetical protein